MRTATPARAPFGAKLATFCAALFFVALSIAIAPNVMDALVRFGLIHGSTPRLIVPTPAITIRDAVPAFVPPVAPQETPQAPARENIAPISAPPISAPTALPVEPVGIKVIVIKPADGSGPIVLRNGTKYRSRP